MNPGHRERLLQFLAGRENKQPATLKWMMQRFDRMASLGFDFHAFSQGEEPADEEATRFIANLRTQGWGGGIRNYQKNINALARFHKYRLFRLKLDREARPKPRIYSRQELDRLHSLPFGRRLDRRRQRALILCHLAFGMRPSELGRMLVQDLDPAARTFFVRFPAKGNPQRTLPVEEEVFRPNRALMAYVSHRPSPRRNQDALWVRLNGNGEPVACTVAEIQDDLREAGRLAGVRANCNRGRHTRATALVYNGKKLPFVAYFLGHANLASLYRYVELVDADLAKHLEGSKWLRKTDRRLEK